MSFTRDTLEKIFLLDGVLKVDPRIAYDMLECPFLKDMLIELGFPHKFVSWLMECVSIVSYSLIMNGGLTSHSSLGWD